MKSVGIIGSGQWGRNIARSFSKKRNIKRVVSSGNKDNLAKMREIVPSITFSSMNEVLDDEDIDAVIVAVSIDSLSDIAVQCLENNKHVFLEKPAGSSAADIERIEAARGDRVCLVNYLYLIDPSYLSFKNAVMTTKTHTATFVWKKWGSFDNDILLNLASHDLSMIFDSLELDKIKNKNSRISDDTCALDFDAGSVNTIIDIDRKSKVRHKTVAYETENGLYLWTPGFFAHDEIEVSSNTSNNLLDIQRDNFLSFVDEDAGYTNLGLSKKILECIDGLRQ